MNILHLDSSILGPGSVSRSLSAAIVARLHAVHPEASTTYRDLAAEPIAHLSGAALMAGLNPAGDHAPETQADVAIGQAALREFLAADIVVIGVAFYNFGIASQLKAWLDRILIAGQTFRYGPDGRPEGLCGAKRVILGVARGGVYGPGSPAAAFEHAESHLRTAFGFMGITRVEAFVAEGVAVGPDQRAAALAAAEAQIATITA